MTGARTRLDQLLVARALADNRSRARALIMAGDVRVDGRVADKAGALVDPQADIEVAAAPRFVGRGGDKLATALAESGVDPNGRTCMDVGASTGGFTDCLLQHGAAHVIAVDVGYGQLDWKLRQDNRVTVRERVNARYLDASALPVGLHGLPDLLVMDVSFIGIGKVLPAVSDLCAPAADALILVKPQFECGPQAVAAGGVVAAAADRRNAVESGALAARAAGWAVRRLIPSPIRGAAGNWECFLHLSRPQGSDETASLDTLLASVDIPEG